MIDEIYDRGYQSGRGSFHNGIDGLFHRLADSVTIAFETLHRIEWEAPWNAGGNRKVKT